MTIRTRERATVVVSVPDSHALSLPADVVHQLAHGFGDAKAVARLAKFQVSLRMLLLAKVFAAAGGAYREAIETLERLDVAARPTLREVMAHPYIRVWALRCLDETRRPDPGDFAHLASIAAAAAIRAGADADLVVPVREGAVHLPTLGRLVIGERACGSVRLRIVGGACSITSAPGWQPVRRVLLPDFAGGGIVIEDTDPFRDCHHWAVTGRVPEAEADTWLSLIPDAWDLLARDHAAYAPGIAAGLSTIVPLLPSPSGRDVSSTARHAYGSIGVALPSGPAALALLMIHEFQHVKLGAVLDMADLHDPYDARLFPAPWRDDPRPLEGLLQGTYAHVGVTDFWRVRRRTAPTDGERAHAAAEFELWLGHTLRATRTLAESGSLTPLGTRFAETMAETLERWSSED